MTLTVLIGNSHVGALKSAWDLVRGRFPRDEMTFLAAPGKHFDMLSLDRDLSFGYHRKGTAPAEMTDLLEKLNGRSTIDLKPADRVVWAGYIWPSLELARLLAFHDIDGLRETGAANRLSRTVFEAILTEFAVSALPPRAWRNWQAPELIACLVPMPAETRAIMRPKSAWARLARNPQGVAEAYDRFFDVLGRIFAENGIGLLRPPAQSLGPSGFTDPAFTRNSDRSMHRKPEREDDTIHMNTDYGVLCLDALLAEKPAPGPEYAIAAAK